MFFIVKHLLTQCYSVSRTADFRYCSCSNLWGFVYKQQMPLYCFLNVGGLIFLLSKCLNFMDSAGSCSPCSIIFPSSRSCRIWFSINYAFTASLEIVPFSAPLRLNGSLSTATEGKHLSYPQLSLFKKQKANIFVERNWCPSQIIVHC